jgi:hypothetical protein
LRTTQGKNALGAAIAQTFTGSIAVGVGTEAATTSDKELDFEVFRTPIDVAIYDYNADQIVIKATLPNDLQMKIYEVGIFSTPGMRQGITVLADFEPGESWDGDVAWTNTNTRVGAQSLDLDGSASITTANIDLGLYRGDDVIELAAYGTGTVDVDFVTDEDNYYRASFTLPGGYSVARLAVSDLVAEGNPSNFVNMLRFTGTAELDGLRIDPATDNGILIERTVLSVPTEKTLGRTMDIELIREVNL